MLSQKKPRHDITSVALIIVFVSNWAWRSLEIQRSIIATHGQLQHMLSGVQVLFCNRMPSPLTTCTSKFLLTTVRPIHVQACWRGCVWNPGAPESCCHMNIQWLKRKMIACSCYEHVLQTSVRL